MPCDINHSGSIKMGSGGWQCTHTSQADFSMDHSLPCIERRVLEYQYHLRINPLALRGVGSFVSFYLRLSEIYSDFLKWSCPPSKTFQVVFQVVKIFINPFIFYIYWVVEEENHLFGSEFLKFYEKLLKF